MPHLHLHLRIYNCPSVQLNVMVLREHVIVAGNPGVGKSFILNCILGSPVFKSGVAFGSGLTTALNSKTIDGVRYSDTPGLNDVKISRKAAREISKAFRKGGRIKLFFVTTLEAGRLRLDDVTTMKVILDAIRDAKVDPNKKFSVIFNKCEPEELECIKNIKTRAKIEVALMESVPAGRICYMPYLEDVAGKQSMLVKKNKSVFKKLVEEAPVIELKNKSEFYVKSKHFEDELERISHKVRHLEAKIDYVLSQMPKKPKGGVGRFLKTLGSKICTLVDDVFNTPMELLK
ncbi:unnamed protein product [Agarophyton chilense]